MAKKLTAKAPLFGNNRSHSCRATKHKQNVNLQKVTLEGGEKVILSARELRTLKKASKNVEVTEEVIIPFNSKEVTVWNDIPIAIKIVQGRVPDYYNDGALNKNSSSLSVPIDIDN